MRIDVVFVEVVFPKYQAGDVRSVAGGYARNFLIPKGFAVPATTEHRKKIASIKKVADVKRERESSSLQGIASQLEGLKISVLVRAGDQGRLYGSVTSFQIADIIKESTGIEIDRRSILLSEPIKIIGVFDIPVRLHQNIIPIIHVTVQDELHMQLLQNDEESNEITENELLIPESIQIISELQNPVTPPSETGSLITESKDSDDTNASVSEDEVN
jgi:large subunit ribosomal protein L9